MFPAKSEQVPPNELEIAVTAILSVGTHMKELIGPLGFVTSSSYRPLGVSSTRTLGALHGFAFVPFTAQSGGLVDAALAVATPQSANIRQSNSARLFVTNVTISRDGQRVSTRPVVQRTGCGNPSGVANTEYASARQCTLRPLLLARLD
jgi:hypothetical protein